MRRVILEEEIEPPPSKMPGSISEKQLWCAVLKAPTPKYSRAPASDVSRMTLETLVVSGARGQY